MSSGSNTGLLCHGPLRPSGSSSYRSVQPRADGATAPAAAGGESMTIRDEREATDVQDTTTGLDRRGFLKVSLAAGLGAGGEDPEGRALEALRARLRQVVRRLRQGVRRQEQVHRRGRLRRD